MEAHLEALPAAAGAATAATAAPAATSPVGDALMLFAALCYSASTVRIPVWAVRHSVASLQLALGKSAFLAAVSAAVLGLEAARVVAAGEPATALWPGWRGWEGWAIISWSALGPGALAAVLHVKVSYILPHGVHAHASRPRSWLAAPLPQLWRSGSAAAEYGAAPSPQRAGCRGRACSPTPPRPRSSSAACRFGRPSWLRWCCLERRTKLGWPRGWAAASSPRRAWWRRCRAEGGAEALSQPNCSGCATCFLSLSSDECNGCRRCNGCMCTLASWSSGCWRVTHWLWGGW